MNSIHRLVEQQVAVSGDRTAIVDGDSVLTYRELNALGNAVARHLMAAGFRRGGHANICLPLGGHLAAALLGVLKAGGSYSWIEPARRTATAGLTIGAGCHVGARAFMPVDIAPAFADRQPRPNLPILTRSSDIACVLADDDGLPAVMVPHETVVSLAASHPFQGHWVGEAGAFDLWVGLIAGLPVSVSASVPNAAAA